MNSRKHFFIAVFSFVLLFSCNKTEKKVSGTWAIDKIILDSVNIKGNLSVNVFRFGKDKRCELPLIDWKGSEQGKWKIEKDNNNIYLIISSQDNKLSGKYILFFFKDPKTQLHKMVMLSPHKEIICSKFPGSYSQI